MESKKMIFKYEWIAFWRQFFAEWGLLATDRIKIAHFQSLLYHMNGIWTLTSVTFLFRLNPSEMNKKFHIRVDGYLSAASILSAIQVKLAARQ